jgi:hypothetical protein
MERKVIYTDDELTYSAGACCHCGAGLAYPKMVKKEDGSLVFPHCWNCSKVLTGKEDDFEKHDWYPFAFFDIKSEDQPSAEGHTTRPKVKEEKSKWKIKIYQVIY